MRTSQHAGRTALALGAVAAATLGMTATPAQAADALVTLAVGLDTPTLSITAPTAVVVPGSPASATIATTVADLRLSGTGWTATISSTDLTYAGVSSPSGAQTIAASTITAYTGNITPVLPTVTIDNEYTSGSPLTLSNSAQSLVVATGRTNVNTSVFTTTLSIPTSGKTAGLYTGTVTQSVS
jgi:hypothetical protein